MVVTILKKPAINMGSELSCFLAREMYFIAIVNVRRTIIESQRMSSPAREEDSERNKVWATPTAIIISSEALVILFFL